MPYVDPTEMTLAIVGTAGVFTIAGAGAGYFVHEIVHRRSLQREERLRRQRLDHEAGVIRKMTTAAHEQLPWPDAGNRYGLGVAPRYTPAAVPVPPRPVFVDSDTTGPVRHAPPSAPISPSPLVDYTTRLGHAPAKYDWTSRASAAGYTAVDLRPATD
ncbi:MAG: hypothetical protein ABW022_08640 [Actinoplanes sp.]